MVLSLLKAIHRILLWVFERKSSCMTEPYYFTSDFGTVCTVIREAPKPIWCLETNGRSIRCSTDNLFLNALGELVRPSEIAVGDSIYTTQGMEMVTSCHSLGVLAYVYRLEVIAAPKRFEHLNVANGFVVQQAATGDTAVTVNKEPTQVVKLVQRGPIARMIEAIQYKILSKAC